MERGRPTFVASGFFAFRSPLLPIDELVAWGSKLAAPGVAATPAGDETLAAALAADRATLRARLRAAVARPEVREALFLASPSLDESLAVWESRPDDERGQKVERTLSRYFARMTSRCTPFGLFAGCSTGAIGDTTRLALPERATYRRQTRLDMDYVFALCEVLARDPELRGSLVYRPNTSLYRAAGQLRYAEAREIGKQRSYHLVALEPSDYLLAALARAAAPAGARLAELVAVIVELVADLDPADAEAFVAELVDAQIIVPDLQPPITGDPPIETLAAELRGHAGTAARAASERLDDARRWLASHDAGPLGAAPARYRELAERLAGLPVELDIARLFQVDMVKPAPALVLGRDVVDEIAQVVELMNRIAPARGDDALDRFRDAFARRYEDREVPLAEALDEEGGVGFEVSYAPVADASPLLEGLAFPPAPGQDTFAFTGRTALALAKLERALATGAHEIVLEPGDLEPLASPEPRPLPESFAALVTIAARDEAALAAGAYRIGWTGVAGPSGANLLGRFCHNDELLARHVRALLRAEEALDDDAIHAEIVHLPEGRIGNILARPQLRAYEIPFLGRASVARDHQIALDDLVVSVRGRRVVLRSRRLGKEVLPRMTTAHNFASPRNLGVYRFLCAFQAKAGVQLGWSWGPFERARFLPRVVIGRCVLSPATWRVHGPVLAAIGKLRDAALFRAAQALRHDHGLPRHVEVVDFDNTLVVDFDNILSIETFAQLVKQRGDVVLAELFPAFDDMIARGPEGRFAHELVVPFVRTATAKPVRAFRERAPAVRSFAPGSEWLYARLFAGPATIDHVLRSLAPVIERATASGVIDRWFFLRYDDPAWHLRVRFHGAPRRLTGELLPALEEATRELMADGRVYRLELGTYDRELERYGGAAGIALVEDMFHADSAAALGIVELLEGDAGHDARWRLAVRSMDQLIGDLGLDRYAVVKPMRESWGREFRADVALERQLGERFRRERKPLEALLDPTNDAGSPFAPALACLTARSAHLAPIGAALREAAAAGRLEADPIAIAGDLLHMTANRLLRSAARAQELVIYDLLVRIYEGRVARARRGNKAPP